MEESSVAGVYPQGSPRVDHDAFMLRRTQQSRLKPS